MYRALVVVAGLAGCGFQGPSVPESPGSDSIIDARLSADVAPGHDAPASHADATLHDAAIDAPPACDVQVGAFTVAGHIGGTGGSQGNAVICQGNEVPVGIELAVTQSGLPNHENMPAVVDISVRCGAIARGATGWTTTFGEVVNRVGGQGTCSSDYDAPTSTAEQRCPPGAAITAISGNELDTTLYNTVSVTCTSFADGSTTTLTFADTGNFTNQPQHPACASGSIVAQFGVREACGQDQLELDCAPARCE